MRSHTTLFVFALVAAVALHSRAEVTYENTKDGNNRFDVIRMTVTPAAAPVPSLRYRLVSRDVDLKPGNSVPYYYRAMLNLERATENIRKKYSEEEINLWETPGGESTPIRDLPLEKLRDVANSTLGPAGEQLKVATTRRECTWDLGIEDMRGPEVVSFLLPEFQSSRELARMLTLRTRLEIAERRYDDAIETMRQQYRLGHDVSQVPFLVCGLIGIAIDGLSNAALVEFIANPDSPNMYWALTELPQPLVSLQTAAKLEMDFGLRLFPYIHNAETTEHSAEEWNRLFTLAVQDFGKAGGDVNERIAIRLPGFDQRNRGVAVLGKIACDYAARCPRANNDNIICFPRHQFFLVHRASSYVFSASIPGNDPKKNTLEGALALQAPCLIQRCRAAHAIECLGLSFEQE